MPLHLTPPSRERSYEDDEDNGEWFLYTGSGGRDLSGNKRTCKKQSHDQSFDKMNLALKISCIKGLPVRVVRSHKARVSAAWHSAIACLTAPESNAPPTGKALRIRAFRAVRALRRHLPHRKVLARQGEAGAPDVPVPVCALRQRASAVVHHRCAHHARVPSRCMLLTRPLATPDQGDKPRAVPHVAEITPGVEVFQCKGQKWWDYDPDTKQWGWTRPPPESQKPTNTGEVRLRHAAHVQQPMGWADTSACCPSAEAEAGEANHHPAAALAQGVWLQAVRPGAAHAAHHAVRAHVLQGVRWPVFWASTAGTADWFRALQECIEAKFVGAGDARDRAAPTGRSMREVKVVKPCPVCKVDIADCLRSVAVNTGMAETISQLQRGAGGEDGADGEATDGDDPDDGTQEVRRPLCAA